MTRRKFFVHAYAADRGGAEIKARSKPIDKSFITRAKVSKVFIYRRISYTEESHSKS
jgi:hypothetical protein